MCLWYIQTCPDCDYNSSITTKSPLLCDKPLCERRDLDPNYLTGHERYCYIEDDLPCNGYCSSETCGLLIRIVRCGTIHAVRQHCEGATETESEPEML